MTTQPNSRGFSLTALTAAACVVLSVACGQTLEPVDPGGGGTSVDVGGDAGDGRGPPERDAQGDPDSVNDGDAGLAESDVRGAPDATGEPSGITATPQKSHIMLLIDRSGSMAEPSDCGEASCPSRWEQLVALGVYLSEIKRSAFLGLALFPSPEEHGCSVQSSLMIPLTDAPDVDEQIMAVLNRVQPGGRTPLAAALDEMARVGGLDNPENDNVLVILTDGRPNCACASGDDVCERDAAVAAAERLVDMGSDIGVYVVGFGASAQAAHETLSAVAAVHGRSYYQVDTIEDLIGLLYEVAVENAPCTYYLDEWPYPERVVAWIDGEPVQPCAMDPCERGYTYDPVTGAVEFHGATCEGLRDGEAHNVWFDAQP